MIKPGRIWNYFFKDKISGFGFLVVLFILLFGIFAPIISPHDPYTQILDFRNKPPGFTGEVILYRLEPDLPVYTTAVKSVTVHKNTVKYLDTIDRTFEIDKKMLNGKDRTEWNKKIRFYLGSDNFGRDILSRLLYGIRISLLVGFCASTISLIVGVFLGALAGYYGGLIETCIMRVTDIMFGFPLLLFLIGITAAFEPSLTVVFFAIGFVSWPGMARITRGQVKQTQENEFVKVTEVLGFGKSRMLWKHIVPNSLTPIVVMYTLSISSAIMAEASLSFLGLGAQPPIPSLGAMINSGIDFIKISPWISIAPGFVIASIVIGFNMLGDDLKSTTDPLMKK